MIKIKEFLNSKTRIGIRVKNENELKQCIDLYNSKGTKTLSFPFLLAISKTFESPCFTNAGYVTDEKYLIHYQQAPIFDFNDLNYHNLTARENATYSLLVANSLQGKWTTKEEILNNYPYDSETCKDGYVKHETAHDLCSSIWRDIESINLNPKIDKIIISNSNNSYKVASSEKEASQYIKIYHDKAMKSLVRFYNLKNKMRKNGQVIIDLNDENCKADIIATFINEME